MFDFFLDEETKSYNRGFAAGESARQLSDIREAYQDGYKDGFRGHDSFIDDEDDDE